jgi:hypothetical protein
MIDGAGFTRAPCGDALSLQRLLDGDLDEVAAELLFHHVSTCAGCAALLDELRHARRFVERQLGEHQDRHDEALTDDLALVEARLHRLVGPAGASARRLVTPTAFWMSAATLALVLVVAGVAHAPVSASGDRMLTDLALRERTWLHEPNVIRHWVMEADLVGSRLLPDGRYRTECWQANGEDDSSYVNRRFDAAGHLVSARARKPDGTEIVYNAFVEDAYQAIPSTAELRRQAAALPADLRALVETYVHRREGRLRPGLQSQGFREWFTRLTHPSTPGATARVIETREWGAIYYIRSDQRIEPSPDGVVRIVAENYVSVPDLQRRRLRATRHRAGGEVEVEDTRWTGYRDASPEEFRANGIDEMFGHAGGVRQWTAREVAVFERSGVRPRPLS